MKNKRDLLVETLFYCLALQGTNRRAIADHEENLCADHVDVLLTFAADIAHKLETRSPRRLS